MKSEIQISDRALRPAEMRSDTLNVESRTVQIVFSTGAAVKRYSWDEGYYLEELEISASAVDLTRLNTGASLLNAHAQGSMADRLGAVVPGSARIEGGKAVCTVQISRNAEGERLMVDLRDGMPLPISVGYKIHQYEKTEGDESSLPVYRATRWEPMEVSAVPVPADFGAQARNEPQEGHRTTVPVITTRRAQGAADSSEFTMTTQTTTPDPVAAERARAADINLIGTNHNASPGLIRRALEGDMTVPQFREAILDEMRVRQDRTRINTIVPYDRGEPDMPMAEALADAVCARVDRSFKPADGARPYIGLPASELARQALEARGTGTRGMSPNQLVERALATTSDFPTALLLAGQRQLAKGYAAAPSGLKIIAKATTSRDFRPKATVILAGGGQLLKVNEHGEFKRATFVEGVESYALSSFGRIFGITRQALVNDDLGVFADLPARFGRAATEFEATYLAEMLERNPKMGDGKGVFHIDHANLAASGAALSVASLSAGRLAMRSQLDAHGDLVTIVPKYLIVPSALETTAEQLLATITPTTTADANPFAGKLELIVEPRLKSATAWYLAADPGLFPGVEFAHLEGEEGPRMEQRIGFDIDGTEFKVALDFGAAITDFRGLFKNPGA